MIKNLIKGKAVTAVSLTAVAAVFGLAAPASAGAAQTPASGDIAAAYTPEELCSGYTRVTHATISGAVIHLMKATNHRKCVVTIKNRSVGTPTYTAAYLASAIDDGQYKYYAGPVKQQPTCAYWGGQHGSSKWISSTMYCN